MKFSAYVLQTYLRVMVKYVTVLIFCPRSLENRYIAFLDMQFMAFFNYAVGVVEATMIPNSLKINKTIKKSDID